MSSAAANNKKNYSRSEWSALAIQDRIRAMNDTLDDVEASPAHPLPTIMPNSWEGDEGSSTLSETTYPSLATNSSAVEAPSSPGNASKRASVVDMWRKRDGGPPGPSHGHVERSAPSKGPSSATNASSKTRPNEKHDRIELARKAAASPASFSQAPNENHNRFHVAKPSPKIPPKQAVTGNDNDGGAPDLTIVPSTTSHSTKGTAIASSTPENRPKSVREFWAQRGLSSPDLVAAEASRATTFFATSPAATALDKKVPTTTSTAPVPTPPSAAPASTPSSSRVSVVDRWKQRQSSAVSDSEDQSAASQPQPLSNRSSSTSRIQPVSGTQDANSTSAATQSTALSNQRALSWKQGQFSAALEPKNGITTPNQQPTPSWKQRQQSNSEEPQKNPATSLQPATSMQRSPSPWKQQQQSSNQADHGSAQSRVTPRTSSPWKQRLSQNETDGTSKASSNQVSSSVTPRSESPWQQRQLRPVNNTKSNSFRSQPAGSEKTPAKWNERQAGSISKSESGDQSSVADSRSVQSWRPISPLKQRPVSPLKQRYGGSQTPVNDSPATSNRPAAALPSRPVPSWRPISPQKQRSVSPQKQWHGGSQTSVNDSSANSLPSAPPPWKQQRDSSSTSQTSRVSQHQKQWKEKEISQPVGTEDSSTQYTSTYKPSLEGQQSAHRATPTNQVKLEPFGSGTGGSSRLEGDSTQPTPGRASHKPAEKPNRWGRASPVVVSPGTQGPTSLQIQTSGLGSPLRGGGRVGLGAGSPTRAMSRVVVSSPLTVAMSTSQTPLSARIDQVAALASGTKRNPWKKSDGQQPSEMTAQNPTDENTFEREEKKTEDWDSSSIRRTKISDRWPLAPNLSLVEANPIMSPPQLSPVVNLRPTKSSDSSIPISSAPSVPQPSLTNTPKISSAPKVTSRVTDRWTSANQIAQERDETKTPSSPNSRSVSGRVVNRWQSNGESVVPGPAATSSTPPRKKVTDRWFNGRDQSEETAIGVTPSANSLPTKSPGRPVLDRWPSKERSIQGAADASPSTPSRGRVAERWNQGSNKVVVAEPPAPPDPKSMALESVKSTNSMDILNENRKEEASGTFEDPNQQHAHDDSSQVRGRSGSVLDRWKAATGAKDVQGGSFNSHRDRRFASSNCDDDAVSVSSNSVASRWTSRLADQQSSVPILNQPPRPNRVTDRWTGRNSCVPQFDLGLDEQSNDSSERRSSRETRLSSESRGGANDLWKETIREQEQESSDNGEVADSASERWKSRVDSDLSSNPSPQNSLGKKERSEKGHSINMTVETVLTQDTATTVEETVTTASTDVSKRNIVNKTPGRTDERGFSNGPKIDSQPGGKSCKNSPSGPYHSLKQKSVDPAKNLGTHTSQLRQTPSPHEQLSTFRRLVRSEPQEESPRTTSPASYYKKLDVPTKAPSLPQPRRKGGAAAKPQRTLLVLISSYSLARDQAAIRQKVQTIVQAQHIPSQELDGSLVANRDERNNLFRISGIWAKYPQFFIVEGDKTSFWGGWERFQASNENGTLLRDLGVVPIVPKKKTNNAIRSWKILSPTRGLSSSKSENQRGKGASGIAQDPDSPVRSSTSSAFESWDNVSKNISKKKNLALRHTSQTTPQRATSDRKEDENARSHEVQSRPSAAGEQSENVDPVVTPKRRVVSRASESKNFVGRSELAFNLTAIRAFMSPKSNANQRKHEELNKDDADEANDDSSNDPIEVPVSQIDVPDVPQPKSIDMAGSDSEIHQKESVDSSVDVLLTPSRTSHDPSHARAKAKASRRVEHSPKHWTQKAQAAAAAASKKAATSRQQQVPFASKKRELQQHRKRLRNVRSESEPGDALNVSSISDPGRTGLSSDLGPINEKVSQAFIDVIREFRGGEPADRDHVYNLLESGAQTDLDLKNESLLSSLPSPLSETASDFGFTFSDSKSVTSSHSLASSTLASRAKQVLKQRRQRPLKEGENAVNRDHGIRVQADMQDVLDDLLSDTSPVNHQSKVVQNSRFRHGPNAGQSPSTRERVGLSSRYTTSSRFMESDTESGFMASQFADEASGNAANGRSGSSGSKLPGIHESFSVETGDSDMIRSLSTGGSSRTDSRTENPRGALYSRPTSTSESRNSRPHSHSGASDLVSDSNSVSGAKKDTFLSQSLGKVVADIAGEMSSALSLKGLSEKLDKNFKQYVAPQDEQRDKHASRSSKKKSRSKQADVDEDPEFVRRAVCSELMPFDEETAIEVEYMEDSLDDEDNGNEIGMCAVPESAEQTGVYCMKGCEASGGQPSFEELPKKKSRRSDH